MLDRRPSFLVLLIVVGTLGLAGCEPYMSMTDQIPAQTRRATALLPETPRYVGMVDVETALRHLEKLRGEKLSDSLRQTDNPHLRTFLNATGLDPKTDVKAAYASLDGEQTLSAVLFANLTPKQMDRYADAAPAPDVRGTTYRDVRLYHLAFGTEAPDPADTLSVAFLEEGMLAMGMDAGRVRAMVDRHRAGSPSGLAANEDYMALVKRVGHGSTAWLAGRDVVETALRDSATGERTTQESASRVSQAGLQRALAQWTDRMLGLSKVDVSSFKAQAGGKMDRLKERLREQAVSITLTDAGLQGEVYLTMRDDASASSVVDVAEGAVAVAKLSQGDLDDRHRDLLDEIEIERNGTIVHVRFSLDRERLRKSVGDTRRATATRPVDPTTRLLTSTTRRSRSINRASVGF
jgi:hypothetical protein